jgi:hypothetical protein
MMCSSYSCSVQKLKISLKSEYLWHVHTVSYIFKSDGERYKREDHSFVDLTRIYCRFIIALIQST